MVVMSGPYESLAIHCDEVEPVPELAPLVAVVMLELAAEAAQDATSAVAPYASWQVVAE